MLLNVCECFPYRRVCATYMQRPGEVLGSLELGLKMVMSYHVGSRTQTHRFFGRRSALSHHPLSWSPPLREFSDTQLTSSSRLQEGHRVNDLGG